MSTLAVETWLYGSRARGDCDALSDTDILLVGAPNDASPLFDYPEVSVSRYSWSEIEEMWSYGCLLLVHLALEGRRLHCDPADPDRFPRLLQSLPPFTRARLDHDAFRMAIAESLASLQHGGWPDFECGVIATVARHAAVLGAYCIGSPAFGRSQPFRVVGRRLGYVEADIEWITAIATAWEKGLDGSHQQSDVRDAWLRRIRDFVDDVRPLIDDYDRSVLPSPA